MNLRQPGSPDSTHVEAGEVDAVDRPTAVSIAKIAGIVLTGVLMVAVGIAVRRLDQVIGIAVTAVALAILTLPVIRWLAGRIGRSWAIVVNAVASLAGSIAVAYVARRDLRLQADAIGELVNARLDAIQPGSMPARVVNSLQLDTAIPEWLQRLPDLVIVGGEGGTGLSGRLVALVMVVILAAFLQSNGQSLVDWFVARWPRERPTEGGTPGDTTPDDPSKADTTPVPPTPRREVRDLLHDVERRGVGAVRRAILLAAGAATLVAIALQLTHMPAAVVLGVWAGAWFVVPTVGWAVALTPIALLALLDGRSVTLVAVAVAVLCAVMTTIARRRFIDARTIRIGVGPYVVAVALGVAMGGVSGSIVALVIASSVGAVATSRSQPGWPPSWTLPTPRTLRFGGPRGIAVPSGWRGSVVAIVAAAAGVVMWSTLERMGPAALWLLIGSFVAVALSRPVEVLERRTRLTRHAAIGVLLTTIGAVMIAALIAGADDSARASSTLSERLPAVVEQLENTRVIGGWLEERDASTWVADQMNDLPQRLSEARPADWLPSVGARLLDLFWTVAIAVALLVDGGRVVGAIGNRVPARKRRQFQRVVRVMGTALAGYAAGAALVASINGAVVFLLALALGIGLAPVLAVWAFVWNFVPQIGGFMGGLPLMLFALLAGPSQALIAGVVFIAYQFLENNVIQPAVIGAAIDIAPWGTLLAALAGGAAAGVLGAIVLTPLVGVIKIVRAELAKPDFPGATTGAAPVAPGDGP